MPKQPCAPPRNRCQWIDGEPHTGEYSYCSEPVVPARSYRHKHSLKAYPLYRRGAERAEGGHA